jgi:hypothetical protein
VKHGPNGPYDGMNFFQGEISKKEKNDEGSGRFKRMQLDLKQDLTVTTALPVGHTDSYSPGE